MLNPKVLLLAGSLTLGLLAAPGVQAQAYPSKLNFGAPGIGTSVHVSAELFKSLTGTSMQHVPYKGRQFAIPDLIGGQIQGMFDNMPSALPMAKEGKIRALAQNTAKRSPAAPDVPTVAETQRVFKLPEVVDKLKALALGLGPWISTPEELAKSQAAEIVKWAKVVKDSGAKAD